MNCLAFFIRRGKLYICDIQGIFGLLLVVFHMCTPSDVACQSTHTLSYVIVMLCHEMASYGTLMTSSHDVVMTSEA